MNWIKNMSMKTKLISLLLVPCVLFLMFAVMDTVRLFTMVETAHWNQSIRDAIYPFDKLNERLQEEELLSVGFIMGQPKEPLFKAQLQSDKAIAEFKESLEEAGGKHSFALVYKNRILSKLNGLREFRERLNERKLTIKELNSYYREIGTECYTAIDALNALYHSSEVGIFTSYAYYYLLLEQGANQRLNILLNEVFYTNQFGKNDLRLLSEFATEEEMYHKAFLSFATDELKTTYNELISEYLSGRELEVVQQMLTSSNESRLTEGNQKEWLSISEEKSELLINVVEKVRNVIDKNAKDYLSSAIFKLVFLVGLRIVIILSVSIFGIYILRDILGVVARMQREYKQLEDKDLSKEFEKLERLDELGQLQTSFATMGEGLRSILINVQAETDRISKETSTIVNTVNELASCQKETENAVIETNTTMKELRHTSELSSNKSAQVLTFANNAIDSLTGSTNAINTTIGNLNKIQEKIGTISETTTKLNEHCQAIGTIIDSVHDLADQSHVLAVNASIEASKAGEHGKGFVIVAQEVQNLAEQSKQATVQVHGILTDIQNAMNSTVLAAEQGAAAVKTGVEQSSETTSIMGDLGEKVKTMIESSKEISSSSEQQLTAVNQTTEAIGHIRTAAEQQGNQTHQIEVSIANLHKVCESLAAIIGEFRLPDSAAKTGEETAPPSAEEKQDERQ